VLETAKAEVQRKYRDELAKLKATARDLKHRLSDEMLRKEKEVR
jgi:hypothetical protein